MWWRGSWSGGDQLKDCEKYRQDELQTRHCSERVMWATAVER
jgi:hypothetical protein